MNIRTEILVRVYLSFGIIVFLAFAVLYKLFHLQVAEGASWRAMADSLSTRYMDVEAARGNIFSVDGSLLATSVPEYDLRMDLLASGIEDENIFYSKVDSLAVKMSAYFGDKSSSQYSRLLRQARAHKNRYFLLKRNVSYQELKMVRQFPVFNLGKYKGGLIAEQKNKRILPFKSLAARTIGYKNENVQPVGLEGAYASYIDGEHGRRLVQRIAGGVWMPVNREIEVAPTDGADIISTINVNMQDVMQRALEKQLIASSAENGCAILMEVATGEIRAVANLTRVSDGIYHEKFNYAIAQAADPGSTFKLASYLIALDDGKVDTNTIVETGNGSYRLFGHTIQDTHENGTISVKKAFEVSSNVAAAKVIYSNYKDNPLAFTKRLYEMKLNKPLGLQIPGEATPVVKNPSYKSWSGLTLPQMAYGYEMNITPMQTLTLYNAVANGGKMLAPLFVKEIRRLGNTIETFGPRVMNPQIAKPETIKKLQGMMEGVVAEGTGKILNNPLYKIAGKTGTAQIADGASGYRVNRAYQASFAGYFPADKPKYSMIVVIQRPQNGYYGAYVAGPVFREVADRVMASDFEMYSNFSGNKFVGNTTMPPSKLGSKTATDFIYQKLGIKALYASNNEITQNIDTNRGITFENTGIPEDNKIPDVRGMGLKDAMYLLGNSGLKVHVSGMGKVVKQSVEPGNKIIQGYPITIELE
ncbi:cell division protein FtsI (penicillin-binding protein 3) [bacterium A37T11]|nr:cell division protein FtsI (penicillin-binding protein 3) [bacterium A37T11]